MAEDGEIDHIIRIENKKSHAIVWVRLKDGMEASVYVGGTVRVYFDPVHNKAKAHIKWRKD